VIGAAVALWMADSIVGLSSLVGIMMLVGIVVTNAIVLIDRVQNNRRVRGMGVYDALMEGGRTRIRPILMTAIAAILALVPLAVGLSEGAIIASDLAIVVIGGLTTSTLLTLVVVPVMYSLLDRFDRRNRKLDAQQDELAESTPPSMRMMQPKNHPQLNQRTLRHQTPRRIMVVLQKKVKRKINQTA